MFHHLNLLHLALALGSVAAVYLALQETRGRVMRPTRLGALPLVAMALALILLLFQLAARQPPWMFALAFAAGLAGGGIRGATMKLQVDQNWRLVRPTGRRALIWVSLALPVAVALEIGGAVAGEPGLPWRLAAAALAILCAGLIVGRALVLAVRRWRAPHVDLRR